MRHFLAAVRADIGQNPVARRLQAQLAGDGTDGADQPGDLVGIGFGREIVDRDIFALGNHQDVVRRLRIDVVEGQGEIVLIDLFARDLATQDLAKILLSS